MNDSKNNPKPLPPDDFSSTTPNIRLPKNDQSDAVNDWEKTNYNYSPKDLQQDDKWKKTAYNVPIPQNPQQDYGKNPLPNQPNPHSRGDEWALTQANIKLPDNPNQYDQPSSNRENYGSNKSDYGSTTPFINLPKQDQQKFEEPPPPIEDIKEEKPKSGVPSWTWAFGGILAMFFFSMAVFLGVYLFFLNKKGFNVTVKGVPARSSVFVNDSMWGVSTPVDGAIRLEGLKAGETKKIEIKLPNGSICGTVPPTITGVDGKDMEDVLSDCKNLPTPTPTQQGQGQTDPPNNPPSECLNIKAGDFAMGAKCANAALDAIDKRGETFTADQLLAAMNLYIVNFASKDDKIKQSDLAFLQRASGYLKRLEKLEPNTKVEVGGHTDNVGQDKDNQPLSERRAKSVYDSLIGFGVNGNMLTTKGYGAKMPKDTNNTPDGKFHNRRIEYKKV